VTGNDIVRVLVVSETSREFLACRKFFQQYDCQCDLAKSYQEVMQLLDLEQFDIVLSTERIPGGSIPGLVALFSGSSASAFYSLRVEEGHWWLPVLRFGKACFGTPALRGKEFVHVLDRLVKDIKTDVMMPQS
jgi:hypothetical protein